MSDLPTLRIKTVKPYHSISLIEASVQPVFCTSYIRRIRLPDGRILELAKGFGRTRRYLRYG